YDLFSWRYIRSPATTNTPKTIVAVARLIVPITTLRLALITAPPRYTSDSSRTSARSNARAAAVGRGFITHTARLLPTRSPVAKTLSNLCMYSTCAGQLDGKLRLPLQYGQSLLLNEVPPTPHAAPKPLPER